MTASRSKTVGSTCPTARSSPPSGRPASPASTPSASGDGERVLDELDQRALRRLTVTSVAQHHGHTVSDGERLAHLFHGIHRCAVEAIHAHDEGKAGPFEPVDR